MNYKYERNKKNTSFSLFLLLKMTGLHRSFRSSSVLMHHYTLETAVAESIDMQMYCKRFMNFSYSRYEIVECQSHGLLQPAGMFDNVLCDIRSNTKSMTSVGLRVFSSGYTEPQLILFLPRCEVEYELN